MEPSMREIETIRVGNISSLPETESYLPSDSRRRTGYHCYLIEFFQKLKLLSPEQKRIYRRSVPVLLEDEEEGLVADGILAADDVGVDDDVSIDSLVLPEERRAHNNEVLGQTMRKAASVWNNYTCVIKRAWQNRSVVLNNIPLSGLLLIIPAMFVTMGVELCLRKAIYEDWKGVKKELHNKIKLGPSKNWTLQQQWINFGDNQFQLLTLLHIPRLRIPWLVHRFLFGGEKYAKIDSSCIVKKTNTRVFVDIGAASAMNNLFSIQDSNGTILKHNGLVYCACGKLHIIIRSPRDLAGRHCAYIMDEFSYYNKKYWRIYIEGNNTTTMEALVFDKTTGTYPRKDWYHNAQTCIKFEIDEYHPIRFTVSKKNTVTRFFFNRCVYRPLENDKYELITGACT